MASLTIVVDGVEQKVPLQSATVTLGRGLESDVRLKDIKASRRHCQIVKTAKGYQCVDLSSGNGTYVNGVQIKQHVLAPGDRITIGSTTIAFEDAAPKPAEPAPARAGVSPKGPTAKLPVVAAAPPRPAAPKVATDNVPVAPTRRSTDRLEAVKSASQGALKPVSQGALRPVDPAKAGSAAAKPGTRVNKSGRLQPARTGRPAAEAPPKKNPVALIVAGAVVVVLLGAGAFFLFGSHDGDDKVRAQIDQFVKKAEKAEKADHLDEAIQAYGKALELCQGDRYKLRASDLKKLVDGLESRRSAGSAVQASGPKDTTAAEKGPDFAAKKAEISARHKVTGDPSSADWAAALKDWNDFVKGKLPADTKAKAEGEIRSLQAKAREEVERLRKKADGLAQENKMAEAVDLIKQQLARFEHPDLKELHGELETTLKKYDK
jgi:hypothetical protein